MRKLSNEIIDICDKWNYQMLTDYLDKSEPFEVELTFKIGRLGNNFLFFDSIISHFVFLYVLKDKFFNFSYDFDEPIYLEIPIKKKYYYTEKDREYFYLCGALCDIPNKVTFMTKKTQHPRIPIIKDRRVRVNAGSLKNYKLPILYSTRKNYKIHGIGNIELIDKILYNNLNIGKKAAIGYGQCSYKIRQINRLKIFDSENKHYIKPIPVTYIRQKKLPPCGEDIYSPIHPPYYGRNVKYYECKL